MASHSVSAAMNIPKTEVKLFCFQFSQDSCWRIGGAEEDTVEGRRRENLLKAYRKTEEPGNRDAFIEC